MLIGYSVAFKDENLIGIDYPQSVVSKVKPGMDIFLKLADAETVLAAGRLKSPSMNWEIVEVHYRG